MTTEQWVIGAAITAAIVLAVCGLAFALDSILNRSPVEDQPCRIIIDQWGMYCQTHAQRLRSFGSCEGRR